jgi:4-hydroxybenzoate polyprenyltransferase
MTAGMTGFPQREVAVGKLQVPPGVVPLCVDLDGTLIRTDLLAESIFLLLKRNPLLAFLLPLWLFRGKANFKRQIADRVGIDPTLLPYHAQFLEYLRSEHARERPLVLATASNKKLAQQIADHLRLFDHVIASSDRSNLSGDRKLTELRDLFGDGEFDYAGNARVDLEIWPHARRAILVNPERGVLAAVRGLGTLEQVFDDEYRGLRPYLEAMRPHQWLKNLLVLVPLLAAHKVGDLEALSEAAVAFLAFCACTSSAYLLNDLMDLPADRRHPRKRHRPFAAGTASIIHGALLSAALLGVAAALGLFLPLEFLAALGGYYVTTFAYSVRLKQTPLLDVLVLAGLYTLRIIAGGAAVSIMPSFWLLAFSMFLFLSLAMVKRYAELLELEKEGLMSERGRGYQTVDLAILASLGGASGYLAVLVLALYINSDAVRTLYARPQAIWLLCPLLLYWVSRVWLAAQRNKMHDDPLLFALRDSVSLWVAGVAALVFLAAI